MSQSRISLLFRRGLGPTIRKSSQVLAKKIFNGIKCMYLSFLWLECKKYSQEMVQLRKG